MRDVGAVSAAHEYVGGTRGSDIVSSAADALGIRVVREMRGVGGVGVGGIGGVYEMCMCLARPGVGCEGGEWIRGLDLGFANPEQTGGVLDVCLCLD